MPNLLNMSRFLTNVLVAFQNECINIFDFIKYLFIQDKSLKLNTNKKFILIAGRAPNYRVIKYANLLASDSKNLIYLCAQDLNLLKQTKVSDNIKLIKYRSISHLENMVKHCNAKVTIAFCSRTRDAASVLKRSKSFRLLDIYVIRCHWIYNDI